MTLNDAYGYIEEKNKKGSVLGLETVKELLHRLDDPQDLVKVIHIAGTNGKGSIMTFVASGLRKAGYQVGRYISPTVFAYLERFQLNGVYMEEDDFVRYLSRVKEAADCMEREGAGEPTAFEIETAVFFLFCVDKQVDFCLLETGMGGRMDATNVVKKPILTIMASISFDHMQFLGDTLSKIAYEKAGILRESVPMVSTIQKDEVKDVLSSVCDENHAECIYVDQEGLIYSDDLLLRGEKSNHSCADKKADFVNRFTYKNVSYETKLLGDFQSENAATAIEVMGMLCKLGYPITGEQIKAGIRDAVWPGRFEIIGERPIFIRDGAHNEDAWIRLYEAMQKHFTKRRIVYIIGVLKDKEYEKMLDIMLPMSNEVYVVTPKNNIRALPAEELVSLIIKRGGKARSVASLDEARELAIESAGEDGVVLAFGSLSYIGGIHGQN